MSDKPWKKFEREVATFFGGKRCPVLGDDTKADVTHETLYPECKYRKKQAAWSLWETVKVRARAEEKTPVVCLKEAGKRGFLIVVHSDDLMEL